jgi:hypothetical protein
VERTSFDDDGDRQREIARGRAERQEGVVKVMAASMKADVGIVQDMREQDEQKFKMRTACAPPPMQRPVLRPLHWRHGLTACACAACGRRLGRHRDRSRHQQHTRPVARDRCGDEGAVWQLRAIIRRHEEMTVPQTSATTEVVQWRIYMSQVRARRTRTVASTSWGSIGAPHVNM